ncbi:MAG: flavin reductase family protein [Thermodesulfovibrionales bacterium]|nr:flavin reductase family protein [Thermodesulfovibrionales bacterium]MDP3111762.1 flavin reductase family protein [Thermodesulfovibrionales bacterium]
MAKWDDVLRNIHCGLFVVTTKSGDKINGMTVAWMTRASIEPPMVSVSIGKTRYSHGLIQESGVFAVNILKEGQVDVGKHFGFATGRKTDKFENIPYETKITGSPILKNIAGYLDCKVVSSCDAGDHTIFVGEVVDAGTTPGSKPLLYVHEDFWGKK